MDNFIFEGKTISISSPSIWGLLNVFAYRVRTLKFQCGNCHSTCTVQHDEQYANHRCCFCFFRNRLDAVTYSELKEKQDSE